MITEDLGQTVIAGWYTRLAGNRSPRRNHWHTKLTYYQAVAELLAARPAHPLTWKIIIGAARPRGCRSTFYEVAGPHARHGMIAGLIAEGTVGAIEIALRYQASDPVRQLIDETKVWSFWPYRQRFADRVAVARAEAGRVWTAGTEPDLGWATGAEPGRGWTAGTQPDLGWATGAEPGRGWTAGMQLGYDVAEAERALHDALAEWAHEHPGLAAANGHRPPACAVEDLTVLHRGRLAATRAESRLTERMRHTALSAAG